MNAERLLKHFDRIAAAPGAVQKLRRFIRDLAFRGVLARQDFSEEAGEVLLRRLMAESDRKVEPGRSVKPLGPYLLPANWVWARFDNVAEIRSNLVDPAEYPDAPHVAPDNIESATGRLLPYVTVREAKVFSAKHRFEPGCILFSKIRPSLAKVVAVDFGGLCSADMYPIVPRIDRRFLWSYMLSQAFVNQSISEDNRVAMPKINQLALSKICVPVAPLAEQQRIVAKVDELMALCDRLEASLATAELERVRFLEAVLQEALRDDSGTRSGPSSAGARAAVE